MHRLRRLIFTVAVVACGRSATGGSTPNLAGSWSGTISSATAGNGTLSFSMTQRGLSLLPPGVGVEGELTGTWSTTFANPASNGTGTLSGSVLGSDVSITFTPNVPGTCPFTMTGTAAGASAINGTYVSTNCTVASSGTIMAKKQS